MLNRASRTLAGLLFLAGALSCSRTPRSENGSAPPARRVVSADQYIDIGGVTALGAMRPDFSAAILFTAYSGTPPGLRLACEDLLAGVPPLGHERVRPPCAP